MWPATAWDDSDWPDGIKARGWTVMGRLRERQLAQLRAKADAMRRIEETAGRVQMMTAASGLESWEDSLRAAWRGGPTVLAFLFAQPDSDAIRSLDTRGKYFNVRTGQTWDLFFPGYYRAHDNHDIERQVAVPVGDGFASDWFFNEMDFDIFRRHIEKESGRRWLYSGETDLVLVNAMLLERGEPLVDWASAIAGQVSDRGAGSATLTLPTIIERISRDLEAGDEAADYGVGEVVGDDGSDDAARKAGRELMIQALAGIAAGLGLKALGAP